MKVQPDKKEEPLVMAATSSVCPSCSQLFAGKFCSACGEKLLSTHDLTIRHFIEESIEGFTHFDNKFLRSLKLLLFKPGALTNCFEQGRKVPFMKPVQLFIISNILFFLSAGGVNLFTSSFENVGKEGLALNFIYQHLGKQVDFSRLAILYNEKIVSQSKAFIVLFIPFIAMACAVLFMRKKRFFTLHLVFATHFFAFLLLLFTFFHFFVEVPNQYFFHLTHNQFETVAILLNMSLLMVYFYLASRRFYKAKPVWALIASLIIGVFFLFLLKGYRLLLFLKIIYSLTNASSL
ncbi:MAG: hypothetical protein JWP88_215 [Flaviaesturariibacter sp.]|nr:hypothetical protein [Flaviaesturariibacter sp.]